MSVSVYFLKTANSVECLGSMFGFTISNVLNLALCHITSIYFLSRQFLVGKYLLFRLIRYHI